MRKPHPCGGSEWEISRLGTDIGVCCLTCQHHILIPRSAFEKRVMTVISNTRAPSPLSSNPGAADFQLLTVSRDNGELRPLYMEVAARCNDWNVSGNVGLVVGATYPDELRQVRQQCPDLPILLPGIGAQGGDLRASLANGLDSNGAGLIIASSRQVLYASKGADFAQRAREAALDLRDRINECRVEATAKA